MASPSGGHSPTTLFLSVKFGKGESIPRFSLAPFVPAFIKKTAVLKMARSKDSFLFLMKMTLVPDTTLLAW
jgi:hypothetical protein